MSLADYQAPSTSILLPNGKPLVVRGLSFTDLSVLVNAHMPDLEAVFDLFQSGVKLADAKNDKLAEFIGSLVGQAPGLAANIIAVAAGEPESAPQAETLPFTVQVDLLLAIGELTFTEPGAVKKFLGQVTMLLGATKKTTLTKTTMKATPAKRR